MPARFTIRADMASDTNAIRARYNYAEHLPERQRMMQEWADCLDGLASGAKVGSIRVEAKAIK